MDEYNQEGRSSPDPSLASLEEQSPHFYHDSGDADDLDMDASCGRIDLKGEKLLENSAPFAEVEIMQLRIACPEVRRRLMDDYSSSDDDSTLD